METKAAERSSGYAAFAYIVVVLVAGLLPGSPPAVNSAPATIAVWVAQHENELLLAAWLSFPGLAFFLWYVVGLRAYLHDAPGQDEGLGTYMLVAGVLAGAFALLNAFFQAVLGYRAAELGPSEVRVLYDGFALSGRCSLRRWQSSRLPLATAPGATEAFPGRSEASATSPPSCSAFAPSRFSLKMDPCAPTPRWFW